MWTMPLGTVETTTQADLLQRIGRRVQHLAQLGRHVAARTCCWPVVATTSPAVSGSSRSCASAPGPSPAAADSSAPGRTRRACAGFDSALRTSTWSPEPISALARCRPSRRMISSVLVLGIGADRACRCRALADDLDHVAFGEAELGHQPRAAGGQCRVRCPPAAWSRPAGAWVCVLRRPWNSASWTIRTGSMSRDRHGQRLVQPTVQKRGCTGQKRRPTRRSAWKVVRRGCLKGRSLLAPAQLLCKCEEICYECKKCTWDFSQSQRGCGPEYRMCTAQ